jgi:molecular chaperone DnaK
VFQGERPMAKDNRKLGEFNLDGIPPAPRSVPQIEVTFDIDANGILQVSAKDKATLKSHNIRIEAKSGLSDADIQRMKAEAEQNAEADALAKAEAEKVNEADSTIFQTEKSLKEYGDKIPADKKEPIEAALARLKEAHGNRDVAAITVALEQVNTLFQAASEEMYKAGADNKGQASAQAEPQASSEAQDVEFEEVKN